MLERNVYITSIFNQSISLSFATSRPSAFFGSHHYSLCFSYRTSSVCSVSFFLIQQGFWLHWFHFESWIDSLLKIPNLVVSAKSFLSCRVTYLTVLESQYRHLWRIITMPAIIVWCFRKIVRGKKKGKILTCFRKSLFKNL
jgi:hypothetical protein